MMNIFANSVLGCRRRRPELSKTLRGLPPRNEYFAGLCILACANGLGLQIIQSIGRRGWADAVLNGFEISAIIFIACAAGISFILRDGAGEIRPMDCVVGAVSLVLIILPIGATSWLALTALSVYMLLLADATPQRRRGAVLLLAITVPMLWSRLLFECFSKLILEIDATLVGWVMGTDRVGNMVRFAHGPGILAIYPACSSLANMSLAFLCWVTISQCAGHRWAPRDILWCSLIVTSVVAVNVTRLSIMGLSEWHYQTIHNNQWGEIFVNVMVSGLVVGISVLGVRRELFSRA
jgi:hypothetical protein